MKEYLGVHHTPYVQTIYLKIKADNREQARFIFDKYIDQNAANPRSKFDEVDIIELSGLETID